MTWVAWGDTIDGACVGYMGIALVALRMCTMVSMTHHDGMETMVHTWVVGYTIDGELANRLGSVGRWRTRVGMTVSLLRRSELG